MSLLICLPPIGLYVNFPSWVCWFLWITRNRHVFENHHISAGSTISSALASAREWKMAQQGCLSLYRISAFLTGTITPPPQTVVCNSEAAWSRESGIAGLGWIYDYTHLNIKEVMSKCFLYISSPLKASPSHFIIYLKME